MKILFVCMGNICRSPTAEGVMRQHLIQAGLDPYVQVDSAGTHGGHAGDPPDMRAQRAAAQRGYDISRLRARKIAPKDFNEADLILSVDDYNLSILKQKCPTWHQAKLARLLDYRVHGEYEDVPDPYYGGTQGFDLVLDLIEDAAQGLIAALKHHGVGVPST